MDKMLFESPDLHLALQLATQEEKEAVEFGIVQLDPDGIVVYYNRYESAVSGLSAEKVVGRNFFVDVAPCTNNFMVAQKFAVRGELDERIDYVFTFRMRPTRVKLRLLMSARFADSYVLVQRL